MPEGTAWSPVDQIVSASLSHNNMAQSGRNLHLIYSDLAGNVAYKQSLDEGSSWSAPANIASGDPELTNSVCVEGTSVHIFYIRTNVLYHKRSLDNGATWGSEDLIFTGTAGNFFRLSSGVLSGFVHVIWTEHDNGTFGTLYMKYRRSTDNGATWQSVVDPYPAVVDASRPALDVHDTSVHISWADLRGGGIINQDMQIYVGRSLDFGATWQTEQALTVGVKQALRGDITCPQGAVVCCWQMSNNGSLTDTTLDIYYARSTDNGATWTANQRLTNNSVIDQHAYLDSFGSNVIATWSLNDVTTTCVSYDAGATWGSFKTMTGLTTGAPVAGITDYYFVGLDSDGTFTDFCRDPLIGPTNTNILDPFNRPDDSSPPPGPDWTNGVLTFVAGEGIDIFSNQATRHASGGYRQGGYYNTALDYTNVFICVYITGWGATDGNGFVLYGRLKEVGSGTTDGYGIDVSQSGAVCTVDVWRVDNAATTTIGTAPSITVSAGDYMAIEITGTRIRAWHKAFNNAWQVIRDESDSTYASAGFVGMEMLQNQETKFKTLFSTPTFFSPPGDSPGILLGRGAGW